MRFQTVDESVEYEHPRIHPVYNPVSFDFLKSLAFAVLTVSGLLLAA